MPYWEARSSVEAMLDPYNGDDLLDCQREALRVVLEQADKYEGLKD